MNEKSLREQLEIDTKLELLKEHKCCAESILCIETYMYYIELESRQLKEQLKQKEEVINEAIKKCELEISASSYQYDKSYKQQDLCYKVAHERILGILQKYKGDNNE